MKNIIRSIVGETTSKESELEECIRTYSFGTDRHSLLERVYRLLYYFMFQLSYVHQSNNFSKVFDYSKYEEDAFLSLYVPILANVEVAILKLNRRYPYWDSYEELNELSAIFKEFVIFEKRYSIRHYVCLSIRNCIKRAPKSTVPGQHRFGFEKPHFCSL